MMAEIRVSGLADLNRALRQVDKDVRLGMRKALREAAEPVRADAELLALGSIPNIGFDWSRMRTGQTQRSVYVVPKQRGAKGRGNQRRRRPNLKPLLLSRSMEPALERNRDQVVAKVDHLLGSAASRFNRG